MTYIGSKINVTTKTGNQYDGILTAVNTQESTLELQMVRLVCSGGRPVKNGNEYDFIVFKSDDIEDLYVYESNQGSRTQQAPKPTYADPAIVNAKPSKAPIPPQGDGQWSNQSTTTAITKNAVQYDSSAISNQKISFGAAVSSNPTSRPIEIPKSSQLPKWDIQPKRTAEASAHNLVVNSETITSSSPSTFAAAAAAPTFTPGKKPQTPQKQQHQPSLTGPTHKIRSYSTVTKQMTHVEVPVSNSDSNVQGSSIRKGPIVPSAAFDFDHFNSKFDKDQVAAEVAPALSGDGPYYNKTASFFDNISSETVPGHEEKSRNERSWNMETFGAPFVRTSSSSFSHGRNFSGNSKEGYRYQSHGQKGRSIRHHATGTFQTSK